jgi:hypothetical protein
MARLFTLDEANALLPELRELLAELRRAVEEHDSVAPAARASRARIRSNGHAVPEEPLARQQAMHEEIRRQLGRVQALGIELKDLRAGLVDFPSLRDGRTVYLCWKLDEPAVMYWHPVETGFADRRPL